MRTPRSSINYYNHLYVQPVNNSEVQQETYKKDKNNRNEKISNTPGLTVIRPINKLFSSAVDHHHFPVIKKSSWNNVDKPNDLSKMKEKTSVQIKD